MKKVTVKGRVDKAYDPNYDDDVWLEFGQTQMTLHFSSRGTLARKLRLKPGQKVKVTIEV